MDGPTLGSSKGFTRSWPRPAEPPWYLFCSRGWAGSRPSTSRMECTPPRRVNGGWRRPSGAIWNQSCGRTRAEAIRPSLDHQKLFQCVDCRVDLLFRIVVVRRNPQSRPGALLIHVDHCVLPLRRAGVDAAGPERELDLLRVPVPDLSGHDGTQLRSAVENPDSGQTLQALADKGGQLPAPLS